MEGRERCWLGSSHGVVCLQIGGCDGKAKLFTCTVTRVLSSCR